MVCAVERISREVSLDRPCPECGSVECYPALVRDDEGDQDVGAHCDGCLHSRVLA